MADAPNPPANRLSQLKIDRSAPLRRRRKRWPWVLGLGVLIGGGALLAMPRKTEVQAGAVLAAYPSQQYAELTASGYVVAQRRAAVASKGTGRLIELRVREGSVVKQGELIGRLDASDVQAAVAASMSGVAQSQAAKAQAEAALGQGRAELANAEVELQRQQDLRAQNFVSAQAVDGAERRLAVARSALATLQAAVFSAQAGIAQSQALVKVQQVNQTNTEIRAPFDGVVLVKNANVGDMITPFSSATGTSGAVVTMADMATLEVEAAGYKAAIVGQKGFNGVAFLSHHAFDVTARALPGAAEDEPARYVEGQVHTPRGPLTVGGLYLPNGNPIGTEKFDFKMRWMAQH